jgi:hypothetical protein
MTVVDDGVGFDAPTRRGDTLGYVLIEALADQLYGEVSVSSGPGGTPSSSRSPAIILVWLGGSVRGVGVYRLEVREKPDFGDEPSLIGEEPRAFSQ